MEKELQRKTHAVSEVLETGGAAQTIETQEANDAEAMAGVAQKVLLQACDMISKRVALLQ